MDRIDIEKLRLLSCESVAMRLGFVVKQHRTRCCFHDDHHPSMGFKGTHFRCWSCSASGDTLDLVMRYLDKSFPEACRWLADESNIILTEYKPKEIRTPKPFDASCYARFFEHPFLNDEARRFLFDERRIDPRVVRYCRLSSYQDRDGVPWLSIPYFNREGKLIGVQNRNLIKDAQPRFKFIMGCAPTIYNLPVLDLLKPGEPLYIAEGCSDCWSLLSARHKAIAIPSATLLKPKDLEILNGLNSSPDGEVGRGLSLSTKYHMYPDRDEPGERLFLQLQQVLPNLEHHQLPPDCKDFSDYYVAMKRKEA